MKFRKFCFFTTVLRWGDLLFTSFHHTIGDFQYHDFILPMWVGDKGTFKIFPRPPTRRFVWNFWRTTLFRVTNWGRGYQGYNGKYYLHTRGPFTGHNASYTTDNSLIGLLLLGTTLKTCGGHHTFGTKHCSF